MILLVSLDVNHFPLKTNSEFVLDTGAQHVLKGRDHPLEDVAVHLPFRVADVELHLLGQLATDLPHDPPQPRYHRGKGDHPGLLYPELMKGGNWIATFGAGYGEIARPILGGFGILVGITMLKTFILTTLDSATRIARYIGEEFFATGLRLKPLGNRYLATAIIIGFALYLSLGAWQSIWPIFGASNQLVAALALFVTTTFLVSRMKNSLYTLIPAVFMLVTTVAAIVYEIGIFIPKGQILLLCIGCILLILTVLLLYDVVRAMIRMKSRPKRA